VNAWEILALCSRRHVTVTAEGDSLLRVSGPVQGLAELLDLIRDHRGAVLACLRESESGGVATESDKNKE
jgi:hypothetical protein